MITEQFRRVDGVDQAQDYMVYGGSYAIESIFETPPGDDTDVNVEEFLSQRIQQELDDAAGPVVFMDIGGGASLTALRLGDKYQDAIAESRLAIVTTNADLGLSDYVNQLSTKNRKEARSLYNQNYVHELTADFMRTFPEDIDLPDGTRYELLGGTTIVHERLSLTSWTKDPVAQIYKLGRFLSSRSIYMVPTEDIEDRLTRYLPEFADELVEAHRALLKDRNLQKCHSIEEGTFTGEALAYTIFKGADALPLRAEPPVAM